MRKNSTSYSVGKHIIQFLGMLQGRSVWPDTASHKVQSPARGDHVDVEEGFDLDHLVLVGFHVLVGACGHTQRKCVLRSAGSPSHR